MATNFLAPLSEIKTDDIKILIRSLMNTDNKKVEQRKAESFREKVSTTDIQPS